MAEASPRTAFRREVREQVMAVAAEQLQHDGWDQVRIGAIAKSVGVSRPTIYAEFGSKDGLAQALVEAETERFLSAIVAVLVEHSHKPVRGVEKAIELTFAEADNSAIVRSILTAGTGDARGNESLLLLITTRGAPVMAQAQAQLYEWFSQHSPGSSRRELTEAIDTLARLLISHLLVPDAHQSKIPAKFGRIAVRLLPELAAPDS